MPSQTAAFAVAESDLIPHPVYEGHYTVKSYLAPNSRLQIRPDGSINSQPNDKEIGPWELCKRSGSKLVWQHGDYPTGTYALPLAEGV